MTETQKVSYTDPSGNTYTEKDSSHYDSATDKWTNDHSEEGVPPPDSPEPPPVDKGGSAADGEANGQGVDSKYGDGGAEDTWKDPSGNVDRQVSVDVDKGTFTQTYPSSKTATLIDSVPARTVPLICQFNSLGLKDYDKFFGASATGSFPSKTSSPSELLSYASKAQQKGQQMVTEMMQYGPPKKVEEAKMQLKKVLWKSPLKISGYKTEHYRIFADNKLRAEIRIVPKVNLFKIMGKGKTKRDIHLTHLLTPFWAKDPVHRDIFKHMVVLYREPARNNLYAAYKIETLPSYVFSPPSIPSDYKMTIYTAKEALKQAEEALKQFSK